jgi:hypothetical protein
MRTPVSVEFRPKASVLRRSAVAAVIVLGLIGACHRAPQLSLKEAKIPSGFTFANTRSVKVSLALPANAQGSLQIALADGKVLYRGPANAQAATVKLAVPLKEQALIATLTRAGGTSKLQLPISAGAASGSFQ